MKFKFIETIKTKNKIREILLFIEKNKTKNNLYWTTDWMIELNRKLVELTSDGITILQNKMNQLDKESQIFLKDCLCYTLENKLNSNFNDSQKKSAEILLWKTGNFCHPEIRYWRENYRIHSKTKSKNFKILQVYDLILENEFVDTDYWYLFGYDDVQSMLNQFDKIDWDEITTDIIYWNENQIGIFIGAIGKGYDDDSGSNSLSDLTIPFVGCFLIELFYEIKNETLRYDIALLSVLIYKSKTKKIEKLQQMKNWMLENGFNSDNRSNTAFNPMKYLQETLKEANN